MKNLTFTALIIFISILLNAQEQCVSINDYLEIHPEIVDHINWQNEEGEFIPYTEWDESLKSRLDQVYNDLINQELGIPHLPEILDSDEFNFGSTLIDNEDALSIYLGHIAQSIYVDHFNQVPWKLANADEEKLIHLFDSKSFYQRLGDEVFVNYDNGPATLGNAQHTYQYLQKNNLIDKTIEGTILRLMEWVRDNVVHYGRRNGETTEKAWLRSFHGYKGQNPIYTMLKSFTDSIPTNIMESDTTWYKFQARYAGGCHGISGFLRGVLRTVNIVVNHEHGSHTGGHNLPVFPEINKYLSHGDDLYSGSHKTIPPYYISNLLQDYSTFSDLFNEDLGVANVSFPGRKFLEENYVPITFISTRCYSHPGESFKQFIIDQERLDEIYTAEELEELLLPYIEEIDQMIEDSGGCGSEGYSELSNSPFHILGSEGEILNFNLNVLNYSKEIDFENRIIRIFADDCFIENELVGAFVLSPFAKATPLSETSILDPNENNKFSISSEDESITEIWQVVFNNTTSVHSEKEIPHIKIFPQPAVNIINIETQEKIKRIEIYGIDGRKYSTSYGNKMKLDIANLESGIYFLRILNEIEEMKIKKFVKN